jgi:hypothetical protein
MTCEDKSDGARTREPARPPDGREARLARALRENLRRRKTNEGALPPNPDTSS